jgi:hypothetical protein
MSSKKAKFLKKVFYSQCEGLFVRKKTNRKVELWQRTRDKGGFYPF